MKCYVVNLPRSIERKVKAEKNLKELGLDYEFFEATDGKHLSDEQLQHCELFERTELSLGFNKRILVQDKLIPSEVGCAFSHLRLYQHILATKEDYACIIEDDCKLLPPLKEALHAIESLSFDWDIITFSDHLGIKNLPCSKKYYFGSSKEQFFMRQGMHLLYLDSTMNARRLIGATACYVVNRKACQRFLEIGFPVRIPSDYLIGLLGFHQLKMFRAYPAVKHYVDFRDPEDISSMTNRPEHKIIRV